MGKKKEMTKVLEQVLLMQGDFVQLTKFDVIIQLIKLEPVN
jgi:hypothetical protein